MSSFWPEGLELTDTQSPRKILRVAQDDWQTNSSGVMNLILQDTQSESGNPMIIVHAMHVPSNRTATLFSVVHRPNRPYPVAIQPEDEDLPQFLQKIEQKSFKERILEQVPEPVTVMGMARPPMEEPDPNPWVSNTPAEFRTTLSRAFNLGSIKSIVLNLASISSTKTNGASEISIDDEG